MAGSPDGPTAAWGRRAVATNAFDLFPLSQIEQSIPARFEQQVRRYPDRPAVVSREQRFTYAEINEASNVIAHAILEQRGDIEEPAALLLDQGAWVIAAILGALKAGKIYVSLDPQFPRARLAHMIEDSRAGVVVTDLRHAAAAAELVGPTVPIVNTDALGSRFPSTNPEIQIAPDRSVNIMYTSGSTGQPKGVLQNHRNLLFEVRRVTNSFHVCPEDRLALVHLCGSSASLRRIFPALLNGASLYPLDLRREGREDLPAWFIREGITISNGRRLLRDCGHVLTGEEQFPRLRLVTFGGEPVYRSDVDLYRRYLSPHCLMVINLATTETGTDAQYFIDKCTEVADTLPPVGYATEGTDVLLLGEDGREVGPGQIGEIAVRGRYISLGYWRKPELTRRRFLPDPDGGDARIYLTGDLGRMRSDGCLFHLGRKDFQVKVRGHRIEALEVEKALLDTGAFTEAVVLALGTGHETPPRGVLARGEGDGTAFPRVHGLAASRREDPSPEERRLVAYLMPNRRPTPLVSEIRRSLAQTLPEHMLPSVFVMLDEFPRLPSGKVDRMALSGHFARAHPWRTRPEMAQPFVAPRTPIEKALARTWAEILEVDAVGVHDPFLDLGGDSLMAARIVSRLREDFGVNIPLRALFDTPTVEELSRTMAAAGPEQVWVERSARQPQESGSRPRAES